MSAAKQFVACLVFILTIGAKLVKGMEVHNFQHAMTCQGTVGGRKGSLPCAHECLRNPQCIAYKYNAAAVGGSVSECQLFEMYIESTQCSQPGHVFHMESPCLNGGTYDWRRCTCSVGSHVGQYCERLMTDCTQGSLYQKRGQGIFTVYPVNAPHPFQVKCNFDTAQTFIQFRDEGNLPDQQFFNRNWTEYKAGFGALDGEFWLGLDKIHYLTGDVHPHLVISLLTSPTTTAVHYSAHYLSFTVEGETEGYRMHLGDWSDFLMAGSGMPLYEDAFKPYQDGMMFSTYDNDNDVDSSRNCASDLQAGWWFSDCSLVNINGPKIDFGVTRNRSVASIFWDAGDVSNLTFVGTEMSLLNENAGL